MRLAVAESEAQLTPVMVMPLPRVFQKTDVRTSSVSCRSPPVPLPLRVKLITRVLCFAASAASATTPLGASASNLSLTSFFVGGAVSASQLLAS